jgi:hypothetical protein
VRRPPPGTVYASAGAALVLVSFTLLQWFGGLGPGRYRRGRFADLHDIIGVLGAQATGLSRAYFGWLAWVLLALATVIALAARAWAPLRWLGALAGAAGAVVTVFAIQLAHGSSYFEFLKQVRVGFFAAVVGFALMAMAGFRG